jgi:hypothetical protein
MSDKALITSTVRSVPKLKSAVTAVKAPPPVAVKSITKKGEFDSESDESIGLSERLNMKLSVGPPGNTQTARAKKRPSPKVDHVDLGSDSEGSLDAKNIVLASLTPAPKGKGSTVKQEVKRARGKTGNKAAAKPATKAVAKKRVESSDDEMQFNAEASEASNSPRGKPNRPGRLGRAAKPIKYAYSDDESDESSEFDFE